jgi:mannose-1-phosphate guanylyltransferase
MASSSYYACILAGGSGERFWPMSRLQTPKHLLQLLSPRTLIEETVRRLEGVVPLENILVLTSAAQLEGVRAAVPFLPPAQVLAEPARRDTAPAAALATALVRARDPQGIVALFPADAFIRDHTRFASQLAAAFRFAAGEVPGMAANALLTFGVKPTYPATGFGYLELGEDLVSAGPDGVLRRVRRFVEKPDQAAAERYVESGGFAWNAGMFMWRAEAFLAEAEQHAPELAAFIREFPAGDPVAYVCERFPLLPKISVDYALMEKAATVVVLLAAFDWDDVGSWSAMPAHLPADAQGNSLRGRTAVVDSSRNIVVSNGRVVALCGVQDLVVVETADAVLVCHRDAVQNIKKLQPLLPKEVL